MQRAGPLRNIRGRHSDHRSAGRNCPEIAGRNLDCSSAAAAEGGEVAAAVVVIAPARLVRLAGHRADGEAEHEPDNAVAATASSWSYAVAIAAVVVEVSVIIAAVALVGFRYWAMAVAIRATAANKVRNLVRILKAPGFPLRPAAESNLNPA